MIVDATLLLGELSDKLHVWELRTPRDSRVYLPSPDWLREFCNWLAFNRKSYMSEKYDCDDFAIWSLNAANTSLYESNITDAGHSFCFAEITLNTNKRHALNVCRCSDGNWYVVEPQTGNFEEFNAGTNNTIASVDYVWV